MALQGEIKGIVLVGKLFKNRQIESQRGWYLRISKEMNRTRITIPASVKTAIVKMCGPALKKKKEDKQLNGGCWKTTLCLRNYPHTCVWITLADQGSFLVPSKLRGFGKVQHYLGMTLCSFNVGWSMTQSSGVLHAHLRYEQAVGTPRKRVDLYSSIEN